MCNRNLDEMINEAQVLVSMVPQAERLVWHLSLAMTDLRQRIQQIQRATVEADDPLIVPVPKDLWARLLHDAQLPELLPPVKEVVCAPSC